MDKQRITVYNYFDGHSVLHRKKNEMPDAYEVDAYCVGGENGVFATFNHPSFPPNCIGYAQGDDGHWWLVGVKHKDWLPEMTEAFTRISEE